MKIRLIVIILFFIGFNCRAAQPQWQLSDLIIGDCAFKDRWLVYPGSPVPPEIVKKGITSDMTEAIEREKKVWYKEEREASIKNKEALTISNYWHYQGEIRRIKEPQHKDLKEEATLAFLNRMHQVFLQRGIPVKEKRKVILCKRKELLISYYNGDPDPSSQYSSVDFIVYGDAKTGEFITLLSGE